MKARNPNPGSLIAQEYGCVCPVLENNRGIFAPFPATEEYPEGAWHVRVDCPLHGSSYGVEENQNPLGGLDD